MSAPTTEATTEATALDAALVGVRTALVELRRDPTAPEVQEALSLAGTAVDELDAGVSAVTLRRLLNSIDDCHRAGVSHSVQLRARTWSTIRALRLDANFVHPPDPRRAAWRSSAR